MSEYNYNEDIIVPESPKVVSDEVLHVYIPNASHQHPGLATYDDEYFEIDSKSNVKFKQSLLDVKLNRIKNEFNRTAVYGVDSDGNDYLTPIAVTVVPNTLIRRDSSGCALISTPTHSQGIANKLYVDNAVLDGLKAANSDAITYADQILLRSKAYTDDELAKFDFIKVVTSLDSVTSPLPNKIYLVPKADSQNQDLFDEYIWVDGRWEFIGTKKMEVDLTNYATIEYVDNLCYIYEDELDDIIGEVLA